MGVETNTFDRVDRYSSVDLSSDFLVRYKFRTTYSMKRFSLCTLAYFVLGIGAKHEQTVNENEKYKQLAKSNGRSVKTIKFICEKESYLSVKDISKQYFKLHK